MSNLDKFREYFAPYVDEYAVIGGTACTLLLSESPVRARATKDVDMILFVEVLSKEFFSTFWNFVIDGGYKTRYRDNGNPVLFRFMNPQSAGYPYMIELFARDYSLIEDFSIRHIIPVRAPDALSDLSAILLDDDYYALAQNGKQTIDGISTLGVEEIMLLKAKAFLELSKKKHSGGNIHSDDIRKHRTDFIRLALQLGAGSFRLDSAQIRDDLEEFLAGFETSHGELRSLGIPALEPQELIETIRSTFSL